MGSTGYQCGRDGVRYKFTSNNQYPTILMNNLLTGSTGWGIRTIDGAGSTQTVKLDDQVEDYNAYYNNTAGGIAGFTAGAHDVVPTGDPFTNAAGNIYTLNNTAGAGAVVRAAGFPGVLTFGGTGYLDIGALQHADPAAVSGGSFGFVQ